MRVFVSGIYKDSPEQNFQLKDGDLYVQFLWVPRGLSCEIGVVDSAVKMAVDGDLRVQHYIESTAHRALLQMLIADFKQVFGEGWAKALRGLVDREEARGPIMALNDYADWSIPDLFDELISYCAGNIEDDTTEAIKAAITSKARSGGVAEGAKQERERIRGESQMVGVDEDCIKFIGSVDNYVGAAFLVPVDIMDPPVLAPTKEGKP